LNTLADLFPGPAELQIRSGYRAHMSFGLRQVGVKRYAAQKNKFVIENIISVNNDDRWLAGSERRMLQIKRAARADPINPECNSRAASITDIWTNFLLMDII